jgi:hypothetical protein
VDTCRDLNVIDFEYVRATRTIKEVRDRAQVRARVRVANKLAAERKKHNDHILSLLGLVPKQRS